MEPSVHGNTEQTNIRSRDFTQENNIGSGVGGGGVITLVGYSYRLGTVIHT